MITIETKNLKFFETCKEVLSKKIGRPATDNEVLNFCISEFAKQGDVFFYNDLPKYCDNYLKLQKEGETISAENKVLEDNLFSILEKRNNLSKLLSPKMDKLIELHERLLLNKSFSFNQVHGKLLVV